MLLKIPFPTLTPPLPASLAQLSRYWVFHWVLSFSYLCYTEQFRPISAPAFECVSQSRWQSALQALSKLQGDVGSYQQPEIFSMTRRL